jgi:NAD(P)-dependent dehydrogenase (short-subunit alcohol dehydrogenase family)
MYKLDGKKVVITGAASGLGRSLALAMARKGCRIGVVDINVEGAEETLEMVISRGGSGEVFQLDVRDPEQVEAMAEHFFQTFGGVDILFNNAGVAVTGFVGDIPLENWKWITDINYFGMVYGCHSFIPRMKAQGGGYIVNTASAAGIVSFLEMAPYNASKAAVISLTETLKIELAPFNIGVSVVCPMFFNTGLLDDLRYTDEFETEFSHAAFKYARITSDEVAQVVVKGVEKKKLIIIPQLSGKVFWMQKRLSPSLYFGQLYFLNKMGWGRPLFLWMARHGML